MNGDWFAPDGLSGLDGLEQVGPDGAGGHLILDIGDVSYGLPPSHDLGVDAVEDAVTLTDDRGMAVCADTDGDGHVDRLSVVGFDGSWSNWERTGQSGEPPGTPTAPTDNWTTGGWECVERGGWG
ncbi:DUF6802 family protein [uncultured Corynebacterium sp.]|uniref:DUF6802 family protein n=1 Tax=uncultured Corynebacterium sp. TaxID=159447 RepID=UPI0025D1E0FE|nr:DUF6802 family protein [uncultured Corynebacterium sp.]